MKELYRENQNLKKQISQLESEKLDMIVLIELMNVWLMEKGNTDNFLKWAKKQDYLDIIDVDNVLWEEWERFVNET